MKKQFFLMISAALLLASCSSPEASNVSTSTSSSTSQDLGEEFKLWNECNALTKLKSFVEDVTNPTSNNFIPVKDRIATFDMDGTFIGELCPTYLEYNLLMYRGLDDPDYEAPADVVEAATAIKESIENGTKLPSDFPLVHAHAQAKAFAGLTIAEFDAYVKDYMKKPVWGFEGMNYGNIYYKPMVEVFSYLEKHDFTYYVVSGSDRFICRSFCDQLGIEPNRVIGMDVELKSSNQGDADALDYTFQTSDDVIRTENLLIKNLKTNKVKQIAQEIGKVPVLSFGNSSGDSAMHNYCLSNKEYKSEAFMLIADDETRDYGNYEKAHKLAEDWEKANYNVISMKDDFKTIYGDGVVKKAE